MSGSSFSQRRRLSAIFMAASILSLAFGGGSFLLGLRMHRAQERLIGDQALDLILAQRLQLLVERKSSLARRFFLTGEGRVREELADIRVATRAALDEMKMHLTSPAGTTLLARIDAADVAYDEALEAAMARPRSRAEYLALRDKVLRRSRRELFEPVRMLAQLKHADLEAALAWGTVYAHASLILSALLGPCLLLALAALTRAFRRALDALDAAQSELARAKESLEETVARRTRRLENALRLQEELGYSVAHDLRAPARAAAAYSELVLRRAHGLDERTRGQLERIAAAGRRLREMLDALLELALLGQRAPETAAVDLAAEARRVAAEVRARHPRRRLAFSAPDALPERADPELLRTLLRELLDNAWRFARARVELGAREGAYFVADDGPGFEAEFVDRLFKPFHRLRNASYPGLGVGLARAARAAEAHGGRVWAEPRPEGGAAFFFTLRP